MLQGWVIVAASFGYIGLLFAIASGALHVALSYAYWYDLLQAKRVIDGGMLGFLTWSVPMLAGTLAYDLVAQREPARAIRPLLGCAAVKGGGNVARWCHEGFEGLVQKAKLATRQTDRAGFYSRAQEVVKEEAPWIPIAHSVRFDPIRKEVQGYKMDATAHHFFHKVDMPDR